MYRVTAYASPILNIYRHQRGENVYMGIAGKVIVLLFIMLAVQACQTHNLDGKGGFTNVSNEKWLILRGRVSLPLPARYEKILLDDYSTIITAPEYSIVYRWIDKEEMEFIGSDKSPYGFFRSAFTDPASEEEKRFLEGLDSKVSRSNSSSSDLEFYYFDNGDVQQIYILSRSLNFVVEVAYKGEGGKYIDSIITHSNLR